MSVENGKVCCNCRHNKRYHDEGGMCYCECEVSGDWLSYIQVMTGWCKHWAKEKATGRKRGSMTREEAIEYLNTLYMALAVFPNQQISLGNVDEMKESVSMAIKALEQEPCEDAISRQAVLEIVEREQNKGDALSEIEKLPSVKPQEPTGHWVYEKRKRLIRETDEGAEYITDYWCKCSKCGGDFGYIKMKDAFCKYCGAKMVETQESEEEDADSN